MLNHKAKVLYHSSILIGENIFIDPYKIDCKYMARYIFITHAHYDHFSTYDIDKIVQDNTIFIAPKDVANELEKSYENRVISVMPYQSFELDNLQIESFPAYNVNKNFHKKVYNWLGYKITYQNITYAVLGDCDITEDNKNILCDCLLIPIGGTFTMDGKEGANLTNIIKPKLVIPTHYNAIVGTKQNEKDFIDNLDKNIEYEIHIK